MKTSKCIKHMVRSKHRTKIKEMKKTKTNGGHETIALTSNRHIYTVLKLNRMVRRKGVTIHKSRLCCTTNFVPIPMHM